MENSQLKGGLVPASSTTNNQRGALSEWHSRLYTRKPQKWQVKVKRDAWSLGSNSKRLANRSNPGPPETIPAQAQLTLWLGKGSRFPRCTPQPQPTQQKISIQKFVTN